MPTDLSEFTLLSDEVLVATVAKLAQCERSATARLVASLAEFDQRRLYLPEGLPSLFAYCTQRLHLSEHAAYHRIEAARAARRFPVILDLLEEGALTLTAVGLLRPHLTEENHREVLESTRHLGKRAVEELVARLHARSDVRASVRKLPAPRSDVAAERGASTRHEEHCAPIEPTMLVFGPVVGSAADDGGTPAHPVRPCPLSGIEARDLSSQPTPAPRPPLVRALAPARYQVQMTVSAETHAKLRQAQELLRHVVPNGDPAAIFDRALTLLVQDLLRKKCAAKKETSLEPLPEDRPKRRRRPAGSAVPRTSEGVGAVAVPPLTPGPEDRGSPPPRAGQTDASPVTGDNAGRARRSRYVPAAVKRAVWERDGGQCAFVGHTGRCPERGFLEYHHGIPFAAGGETSVDNVSLRCRRHNAHEAERFFGSEVGRGLDGATTRFAPS